MEGYPAHAAGVKAGDKILEINGIKINDWHDLSREVAFNKGAMRFLFQRGDTTYETTITLWKWKKRENWEI